MYVSIFMNKFVIFLLSYYSEKQDKENELISNTSLIAIYLYITEEIVSGIKKLLSLNCLIIIQIIFTSLVVLISIILLLNLLLVSCVCLCLNILK